jgi:hypothetical protein
MPLAPQVGCAEGLGHAVCRAFVGTDIGFIARGLHAGGKEFQDTFLGKSNIRESFT